MTHNPPPSDPDEIRKSNLLMEAQALRAQGQADAAADRFAEAAELEERLAESAAAAGNRAAEWQHALSAAGCWAQAGNFYAAITITDELLAVPDLPSNLRTQVTAYAAAIRARREQWSAGLPLTSGTGS
jgi:hypothetical protein